MMKRITLSFLLILLLISVPITSSMPIEGCKFSAFHLRCSNFSSSFVPHEDEYEKTTQMTIRGNFSELEIDPSYDGLYYLVLETTNSFTLDFTKLSKFKDLDSLGVEYTEIESIKTDGIKNLKKLQRIDFTGITMDKMSANFEDFPNLKALNVLQSDISEFSSLLPISLEHMQMRASGIAKISCQSLKNLAKLRMFSFMYNNLDEFDLDCVPLNISKLDISNNPNTTFRYDTLPKFANISRLDIDSNRITEFNFSRFTKDMVDIDLMDNHLTSLTCGDVSHLTSLKNVDLSLNKLVDVDFSCLPQTAAFLDFSNNQISSVSCAGLKRLDHPNYLAFSHNKIESFDFTCLNRPLKRAKVTVALDDNLINCDCSMVFSLYETDHVKAKLGCSDDQDCTACSANSPLVKYPFQETKENLKQFDDLNERCFLTHAHTRISEEAETSQTNCKYEVVFGLVPTIKCEDFETDYFVLEHGKQYESLENFYLRGSFTDLNIPEKYESLNFIKLESDSLEELYFSTFTPFAALKIVDVSHSRLSRIFTDNSADFPQLDRLNLDHNNLMELDESFRHFPALAELYLSHNNINTFDASIVPPSVTKLDLSNNVINNISGLASSNIKHLDLSWNSLRWFGLDDVPESLEQLLLNNNDIFLLALKSITWRSNLNLNIQNNPINCNCAFATTYTDLWESNVKIACLGNKCLTCRSGSRFTGYPWHNPKQVLEKKTNQCNKSSLTRANIILICLAFIFYHVVQ